MPNKNPRHQSPREAARAFEVLVGRNIQKYRLKKNLTQRQLGEALGLTFQQIQKYENATNRISAGRLLLMSKALGVPLIAFFQEGESQKTTPEALQNISPEALELALTYDKISGKDIRSAVRVILSELGS